MNYDSHCISAGAEKSGRKKSKYNIIMDISQPTSTESTESSTYDIQMKKFSIEENVQVPKGWGRRHTFLLLGFLGFLFSYSLRFNLSIAIVEMVRVRVPVKSFGEKQDILIISWKIGTKPTNPHVHTNISLNLSPNEVCPSANGVYNSRKFGNENQTVVFERVAHIPGHPLPLFYHQLPKNYKSIQPKAQFSWSEEEQGLILGSFFWGYILTQYIGGKLSHTYGPKHVFSFGILITAILSLATPEITKHFDFYGILVVRILQGLAEGVTLPSILVMLAHWAPAQERSTMTNWVYSGIPIGTAATMIVGGYLIHLFEWESVFYVSGGLSLVWFVFWTKFIYNDPSDHPSIEFVELNYIKPGLKGIERQANAPTPWLSILKSGPVWAVLVADLGDSWSHYLLHVEVPIYLSSVHGFAIETNGLFSVLPQISNCIFGIFIGYLSDFALERKCVSVLNMRRICSTVALWGAALGFLGMIYGGCNTLIAIFCLNFAAGMSGAGNSGWVVNHIEIAPNHAGTISGFANTVGNTLGFLAPYATGMILERNPTMNGWRTALAIPAAISFAVSIFYLIFSSGKEQSWNSSKHKSDKYELE